MDLQTIAHYTFPASARDIGTGVYHLAKGNATEEQCQKLVAGAIRVTIAALAAISLVAASVLLPSPLNLLGSLIIVIPLRIVDAETATLLSGTTGIVSGLRECALGISAIAQGIHSGPPKLLLGTLKTGFSWFITRMPRDIQISRGLFAEDIDDFAKSWGSQLYLKLA
ncbi:putative uncharacterized protein [Waddlia chondrophila 2032/99]|uniref:Uncharacterized protein n=1 Tax=Waddlia chondrophila 2032/99 TaxID=765953 RepID=F8LBS1_9BACT|nr:putative uncharacterized protein [Waddlia chondrophila 2032/99]